MRVRTGSAALLLTACARTLPHPAYTTQPAGALIAVLSPPPPGRIEDVPDPPSRTAVWVDGEWSWHRERWAWIPGRWVEPPPHAKLAAWVFVRGADGRLWYAPGAWRDEHGLPVDPPIPLSGARVEATQVINATGALEVTGPTLRPGATGMADGGPS